MITTRNKIIKSKLIITFFAVLVFLFINKSCVIAASPCTKTIKSTSNKEYHAIQIFLQTYYDEDVTKRINHLLKTSKFAAFGNNVFPYPNEGSPTGYVNDPKDPYKIYNYKIYGGTGCWAYSCFVESFIFGTKGSDGHMLGGIERKASSMSAKTAAGRLKELIQKYAQPGEHLRSKNTHSVSYIACDNNGFYYVDYWANNTIQLHYATWSSYVKYYKGYPIVLYECDLSENDNSIEKTFPDQNLRNIIKEEVLKDKNITDDTQMYGYIHSIKDVKTIDLSNKGLTNLQGLECFVNLEELNCSNNKLTSMDSLQENFAKLRKIKIDGNSLCYFNCPAGIDIKNVKLGNQNATVLAKENLDGSYYFAISGVSSNRIKNVNGALFKDGKFTLVKGEIFPVLVNYSYMVGKDEGEMKVTLCVMPEKAGTITDSGKHAIILNDTALNDEAKKKSEEELFYSSIAYTSKSGLNYVEITQSNPLSVVNSNDYGYKTALDPLNTSVSVPKAEIKSIESASGGALIKFTPSIKKDDVIKIYRSTAIDGVFFYVGETKQLEYTDTGVQPGRVYYYKTSVYRIVEGVLVQGETSSVKMYNNMTN